MPPLPKHLTTIAGIDLLQLAQDRPGLKFDEDTRKAIVFWMVENKCTEPSTGGKHLQLIELKTKLGFFTPGLPTAYTYLLEDKLKRDIGILKKQLISTHAVGYYIENRKKGNKPDPTFFFPFTSQWLLPADDPNHIPFNLDLTWDPKVLEKAGGDGPVLDALASVTEFLPKLSNQSRIKLAGLIFGYPEAGFRGFPDLEDVDSDEADHGDKEDLGDGCSANEGSVKLSKAEETLVQTATHSKLHYVFLMPFRFYAD